MKPGVASLTMVREAVWLLLILAACGGGPEDPSVLLPSVTAITPAASHRATTLDLRVTGANFVQGSRVVWRRAGTTDTAYATTKVTTNAVTFVSASELLVSTTIDADARLGRYDVLVLAPGGNPAIGANKFDLLLDFESIDLGAGDNSAAGAVNDVGQIVGTRTVGGAQRAFLWQNGTIADLGVLPGMTYSQASDINGAGTIVGFSGLGTVEDASVQRAFVWTAAGGLVELSSLGGPVTYAHSINENGEIAGGSDVIGAGRHGTLWRSGVITDIQADAGGTSGTWEINAHSEIAGWHNSKASRWKAADGLQDLEFAGGTATGLGNALAINDAGHIVGWRRLTGSSPREAFLWTTTTSISLLATPGAEGMATAINNRGQVVGVASGTLTGAFLWSELDGAKVFGGADAVAVGINETGWIIGVRANRATLWKVK